MTATIRLDALLVTALSVERAAARAHLSDVRVERDSGLALDVGDYAVPERALKVGILETGMGNVAASVLTVRAEEFFRPPVIVMVGVAGGVKDVAIGDVVASSKVYWVEAGKQLAELLTRPEIAPTSPRLVQAARGVVADGAWTKRARAFDGGRWSRADRDPKALVSPIVAGEKVLAARSSEAVAVVHRAYSDAVAVDMEDYGTLVGGAAAERAATFAVRGISDLIEKKSEADAGGSQPLAASNAAAFAFELLLATSSQVSTPLDPTSIADIGSQLYPEGPQQNGLWERAGGDVSRLTVSGPGFARWWDAVKLLERGGGGTTLDALIDAMRRDFPENVELRDLS